MKSVFDKKNNCCGCTACKYICPADAIEMMPDREGFLYPEINQELCIDCGLCRKVCAFQNGYDRSDNIQFPGVYAVKHKNEDVRISSTSGGAFTAISDHILENGGVVFGVAFDDNMNVMHMAAKSKSERNKFKGSKYVQSNLNDVYKKTAQLITEGVQVLFTGTPCQTAGLKHFLAKMDTKNLVLCDIVCHGVPSPLMWREHIKHIQKKRNSKVASYYCRHKVNGWHTHTEVIIFENGKKEYKSVLSQIHKRLFYSNNILRPACYNCRYTNFERPSDITIADFWGIEKIMPEIDDNKGVSLVLVNTEKGKQIFNSLNTVYKWESNVDDCLQPNLIAPTKKPFSREQFWQDYYQNGFEFVAKKYAGYSLIKTIKSKLKIVLKKAGLLS